MPGKNPYMIQCPKCADTAVDWRWQEGATEAIWTMSCRDGLQWISFGRLNAHGLSLIFEHFDIVEEQALPLEKVERMSPADLYERRAQQGRSVVAEPKSDRIGDHVFARAAA